MATSGDFLMATCGDFLMATDTYRITTLAELLPYVTGSQQMPTDSRSRYGPTKGCGRSAVTCSASRSSTDTDGLVPICRVSFR